MILSGTGSHGRVGRCGHGRTVRPAHRVSRGVQGGGRVESGRGGSRWSDGGGCRRHGRERWRRWLRSDGGGSGRDRGGESCRWTRILSTTRRRYFGAQFRLASRPDSHRRPRGSRLDGSSVAQGGCHSRRLYSLRRMMRRLLGGRGRRCWQVGRRGCRYRTAALCMWQPLVGQAGGQRPREFVLARRRRRGEDHGAGVGALIIFALTITDISFA